MDRAAAPSAIRQLPPERSVREHLPGRLPEPLAAHEHRGRELEEFAVAEPEEPAVRVVPLDVPPLRVDHRDGVGHVLDDLAVEPQLARRMLRVALHGFSRGSWNVTTAPRGPPVSSMPQPCAFRISRASARPMPRPPYFFTCGSSACLKN